MSSTSSSPDFPYFPNPSYTTRTPRAAIPRAPSLHAPSGIDSAQIPSFAPSWALESVMSKPRTLYDKIWDDHVLDTKGDLSLIYIDRHLVHEVTSPQAFEGLRMSGRKVRAPHKTLAVVDHNIQTTDRKGGIADPESRQQVEELARNAREFGIEYYDEF